MGHVTRNSKEETRAWIKLMTCQRRGSAGDFICIWCEWRPWNLHMGLILVLLTLLLNEKSLSPNGNLNPLIKTNRIAYCMLCPKLSTKYAQCRTQVCTGKLRYSTVFHQGAPILVRETEVKHINAQIKN